MKILALIAATYLIASLAVSGFAQESTCQEQAQFFLKQGHILFDKGHYRSAADTIQKAIVLFEKCNNLSGLLKSLNLQGDCFSTLNQCDKAIEVLKRSLKLATSKLPGDHPEVAHAYYYLAVATGKCARKIDDAIRLLRKSMLIKEKLYGTASLEIAHDYTFMGYLYDNKDWSDSALTFLNKAMAIRKEKLPPDDVDIAFTLHNFGQVYENLSELNKSLEHHLKALKIRRTKLGDAHLSTLHSINAIGSVYRKFGNFDKALEYYRYALENRKKAVGENHADVSCSYYSIANTYKDIFDYHSAIQYYLQGHRILEKLYGSDTDVLPAYYAVTAKMYGMVGQHQQAIEYVNKAEAMAEKNLGKDHPFRGVAYGYIGDYYGEINDFPRQAKYHKVAIDIYQKAWGAGTVREADILFKMGSISAGNKQFTEAMDHYENALAIYQEKMGKKTPRTASVLLAMAEAARDQYQLETALDLFRKAFASISTYKDSTDIYTNPAPDELESKFLALKIAGSKGQTLFKLAKKKNDLYKLKQSLITYDFAMQLIDLIIADYNDENAKVELAKEARKIYIQAMQAAHELYVSTKNGVFLEKAFVISEKSKSALLLENMRDNRAKTLAGVPESLIAAERDIRIELSFYRTELYQARKEKHGEKIKVCERNIFRTQHKFDSLKEKLETEFPDYYNFKYNDGITTLRELQDLIPDQTAVVEFFVEDSVLYIFSITKSIVLLERRSMDAAFWDLFRDYERSLTHADFILNSRSEADRLYVSSAYLLYEFLLGSSVNAFGSTADKLIIVPDDMLAQFNFGTLVTKKPEGESPDFSTLQYLTRQFRISYAYASTFIKKEPVDVKQSSYSFGGFAPSYSGNQFAMLDTVLHPVTHQLVRSGNLRLPGAEEEVKYLSNLMNGKSWLNAEATETNFKKHAGSYNILHLAMHSLLNNENPEYSELLFSHETDKGNDGYLKVSEIYNLDLNAELVVLSACSSGYGKIQKGEGPISISRAFTYAGCPSVVMSLWKVPDDVTRQVMTFFYQELKNGEPKDQALRLAQLRFVNEIKDPLYHHPYFWAGFVVTGDTEPISSSMSLWVIIGFGLFPIAAVVVIFRKKRIKAMAEK